MEARYIAVLAAGLVIAAGFFVFLHDLYLVGIILVIDIALAMAFQIMGETHNLAEVVCFLSEDARRIVLVNRGNAPAVAIHVILVPLDKVFDLPELAADARQEIPLPGMISEAKAVVTWENNAGRKYSRSFPLSATGKGEEDLLKPAFPIFGWK